MGGTQGRSPEEVTCQTGTDKPLTCKDRFNSRQQLSFRIRFDDVAARARAQGLFCNVSRAVFAHEENFGSRGNVSDSASCFNPIQRRKTDVEQDQVWLQFLRLLNGFQSVCHFANDL